MSDPPVRAAGPPGADEIWRHRRGTFDLASPLLMGVLNVTPDSFSDGGLYGSVARAVARAQSLVAAGAGVIDVGGESTRPGAEPVDHEVETARVVPVIRALRRSLDVPVSVDTRRAAVARAALDEGADVVNDVSALADPEMGRVVADSGAGLVLMHMRGTPATMQEDPRYDDVVAEVRAELSKRMDAAAAAGIDPQQVVVDPGIGFGKTHRHNLELLSGLPALRALGRPILVGVSRKAFLGALIGGAPPDDRDVATAVACAFAYLVGASIFRVHEVSAVRQALQVVAALRAVRTPTG